MTNTKLLLIGWDAADWKVINPLMDQGLMPNLERLVNGGVIGNLATLDPAYSPMLWTSIATGKRPHQHGILGFTEVAPDGDRVRPVTTTSRKVKAIWNILSERQRKTHVVGWWPSYPAERINGINVSNMFQKATGRVHQDWAMLPHTVSPTARSEHFKALRVHPGELTAAHLLPFVPDLKKIDVAKSRRLTAIAKITADAASIHAACTNILRTEPWDFVAVYFDAIDHYCHGFMRYHPPHQPHVNRADFELYRHVISAAYRFHDMMLGRLMDLAGADTYVMLISDHGFQPDHLRPRVIPKEPAGPAYEHSPYGIFCLSGPGIRKDQLIYGASLLDITPTVLHLYGLSPAHDMDGKVLTSVFERTPDIHYIETYEDGAPPFFIEGYNESDASVGERHMLAQLEALGYLENRDSREQQHIKETAAECRFNLARSYLDGHQPTAALPILQDLVREFPTTLRYLFRLATTYQITGDYRNCRKMVDHIRKLEVYQGPVIDILEAGLLLGERKPVEAMRLFKATEEYLDPHHARLYYQIAACYVLMGRYEDAERALRRELDLDYDHPEAHQMLGSVLLQQRRFTEAAESLLVSLGLDYNIPQSHFLLGRALYGTGKYNEAAEAMETGLSMLPDNESIRKLLIKIYDTQIEQPDKSRPHREYLQRRQRDNIIIVSGLPRSGTSLMMQMLEHGGLQPFTDGRRTADENNPRGYYEHELVKSIARNKSWLPQAVDHALKVVAPLLIHLPDRFHYKIIFMERNIYEIMTSQKRMLKRLGKPTQTDELELHMIAAYERQLEQAKDWIERRSNVDCVFVPYRSVIEQPFIWALKIAEFLDFTVLPELMTQRIEQSLYREHSDTP